MLCAVVGPAEDVEEDQEGIVDGRPSVVCPVKGSAKSGKARELNESKLTHGNRS